MTIVAEAPIYDLEIEQGTDWSEDFRFLTIDKVPIDFSGCAFECPVKREPSPGAPVVFNVVVALVPEVVDGVTKHTGVQLLVSHNQTAALVVGAKWNDAASKFVYNLDVIDSLGQRERLLKGQVILFREVKQPGGI